jgi:hypothetical protein
MNPSIGASKDGAQFVLNNAKDASALMIHVGLVPRIEVVIRAPAILTSLCHCRASMRLASY